MTSSFSEFLQKSKDEQKKSAIHRALFVSAPESKTTILREGSKHISFASNDYLGLSKHPRVIAAAHAALDLYGVGSGASRLITGNHPLYPVLEKKLATYKHTEAALVLGSGYLANIGLIPALVGPRDLILADRLVHACMIDGAKISGATFHRFHHNQREHCKAMLEKHRAKHKHCLILTEHVFSMDGDVAPLVELYALAEQYDAWLVVDDAHGLGVIEPPKNTAHIWMGTLSKAAGAYGGYIAGSQALIDHMVNHARAFIFSTGLPASIIAAATEALAIMEEEPNRRIKLHENIRTLSAALEIPTAPSAIIPWIVGENEDAKRLSVYLEEKGFFVPAIRPPTVPKGTARLRFAVSSEHKIEELQRLVKIWNEALTVLSCKTSFIGQKL